MILVEYTFEYWIEYW